MQCNILFNNLIYIPTSAHEQQAASDATKKPYPEMNCQFITTHGKSATPQTTHHSCAGTRQNLVSYSKLVLENIETIVPDKTRNHTTKKKNLHYDNCNS